MQQGPPLRLSRSSITTLQQQLLHCTHLLSSLSSPLASPPPLLLPVLTPFFHNLLTFSREFSAAIAVLPSPSFPYAGFPSVLLHLLPTLPSFLSQCLLQPALVHSPLLPLLLLSLDLLPASSLPSLSSTAPAPAAPLLLTLSAPALDAFLASLLSSALSSPSLSYPALLSHLRPLPTAAMLQLRAAVEDGLRCTGGDCLLPSVLHCLHTELRARSTPTCPLVGPSVLQGQPTTEGVEEWVGEEGEGGWERYVELCEEKHWVDWTLSALALPALLLPALFPPPSPAPVPPPALLRLLSLFYAGPPSVSDAPHRRAQVQAELAAVLALAASAASLPALVSAVSASPVSAPCGVGGRGWLLPLLVALIGRYPPVQAEVSAYVQWLGTRVGPLPTLLYHVLTGVEAFVGVARGGKRKGEEGGGMRGVCEAYAHALTCRVSVPALSRAGEETQGIRQRAKDVLAELKRLSSPLSALRPDGE